ncbi:uncharacterized protein SCHCODRAFT_02684399 [Schizophyllum commune H4-8]|uniref:uncharacterized protein n=1 Tax=Schizophyllum commune (strain H4-8 / FGSC 9210) TaxID=578458 RepID=UPI00215DF2F8|nr:uncharacterized protein SCHCODRAFT_02684399 [Schizophyllum commune H4-8]KAI5898155.1 hypothetical protein SCHCODRAFT_02684399 [Schizophyllum commune H4-8]
MVVLETYLILVFGDIPAVSLVLRMKGHNGYSPCRMCHITGVPSLEDKSRVLYVPLDRSSHPKVLETPDDHVAAYDPLDLPLRTHTDFMAQAKEVQAATTNAEAEALSREYGIKGIPALSHLPSLTLPDCAPYDLMHLIFENLLPNLIKHWTGEFKGLDDGKEAYQFTQAIWEAIGLDTANAGQYYPSAYGPRVPNIALDRSNFSAEMASFWMSYIGPVVLKRRFSKPKYYKHFVDLVCLINKCLQFEITTDEIHEVREGFKEWVVAYERIYYQHDPRRLSACPLTIHALLHIADSIENMGPAWCYWAFPMERYCGALQPAIKSRRFPYASLDRFVVECAQLEQINAIYGTADEMALRAPRNKIPQGAYAPAACTL